MRKRTPRFSVIRLSERQRPAGSWPAVEPTPTQRRHRLRPRTWLVLMIVLGLVGYFAYQNQQAATPAFGTHRQATPTSGFNKARYSTTAASSLWVVVNKQRPLQPLNYAPATIAPNVPLRLDSNDPEMHVSTEMAPALEQLFQAADAAGVPMRLASGYRPYTLQVAVYGSEVSNYGQGQADSESARPGYSEHQTGLAVDLEPLDRSCEVADCFGDTTQGKWLAANAYRFGFIKRYTTDKVAITGYRPEAWHFRYVGTDLAGQMRHDNVETMEEFFGLGAAPDYK